MSQSLQASKRPVERYWLELAVMALAFCSLNLPFPSFGGELMWVMRHWHCTFWLFYEYTGAIMSAVVLGTTSVATDFDERRSRKEALFALCRYAIETMIDLHDIYCTTSIMCRSTKVDVQMGSVKHRGETPAAGSAADMSQ